MSASTDDPQRIWDEYYVRKREERLAEAIQMWQNLEASGVCNDTILALDFFHFGNESSAIEHLADRLSENYRMTVCRGEEGYWLASGTTRPYGVTMSKVDHLKWVEFMCELAQSFGCVFSRWSIEVPSLNLTFDSAEILEL